MSQPIATKYTYLSDVKKHIGRLVLYSDYFTHMIANQSDSKAY